MFPSALDIVRTARPRAVMLENVKGLDSVKFKDYRQVLFAQLAAMGYKVTSRVLEASDYGVPQLRPRFIIVALREVDFLHFSWPTPHEQRRSVGEALVDLMGENGWPGAEAWAAKASDIAPTLVGGSKKHGGPDLGPTRAKQQWRKLGVDGLGLANAAPTFEFPRAGLPRLTIRMAARIQSFPDDWQFMGGKTASYRQIGNAFPPLVAKAVATSITSALNRKVYQTPKRRVEQLVLMEAKLKRGYKCRKSKAQNS
jgi:DNA (cytosine-5)-methyltransferase 1